MGFFDKLKIGGGEKTAPKIAAKEPKKNKEDKLDKKIKIKPQTSKIETKNPPEKNGKDPEEKPAEKPKPKDEKPDSDGELAIDVYETDGEFVIQSTIAGIKAEDLDIMIENDIVTIKGSREKQISEETKKYYYQECYWGSFSRQVILPEEVDGSKAEAAMKDGILTLKIPKITKIQKRKISIKQEA